MSLNRISIVMLAAMALATPFLAKADSDSTYDSPYKKDLKSLDGYRDALQTAQNPRER